MKGELVLELKMRTYTHTPPHTHTHSLSYIICMYKYIAGRLHVFPVISLISSDFTYWI